MPDRLILCCYCGLDITISIFQTNEHVIPKSLKIKGIATRGCCRGCNAMRGNMPLLSFKEHIISLSNANPDDLRLKKMILLIQSVIDYLKIKHIL